MLRTKPQPFVAVPGAAEVMSLEDFVVQETITTEAKSWQYFLSSPQRSFVPHPDSAMNSVLRSLNTSFTSVELEEIVVSMAVAKVGLNVW